MSELATIEKAEVQQATSNAITPMEMIADAVTRGQSIEVVERLMNLQERWEANQGRKAFDQAIANAKAEIKPVVKDGTGHNRAKYATLAAIAAGVDEILSENGLSYRYKSSQDDGVSVTCILSHKDGYSEETTLKGAPDTSGSKNSIQAIGSTVKYLQRYTLVLALGLSTTEDDDDGQNSESQGPINDQQRDELLTLIDETNSDTEQFCKHMGVASIAVMPIEKFETAKSKLLTKKAQANG